MMLKLSSEISGIADHLIFRAQLAEDATILGIMTVGAFVWY